MLKPGIYKHFKNSKLYRVHFLARNSETLEQMVVYEALYPNEASRMWVHPRDMFEEEVELDGMKTLRFLFERDA